MKYMIAALAGLVIFTNASFRVTSADPLTDSAPIESVHGVITGIQGQHKLSLLDANGKVDRVMLHRGTVILPTGSTLEPGMKVIIDGTAHDFVLDANRIVTFYKPSTVVPVDSHEPYGFEARGSGDPTHNGNWSTGQFQSGFVNDGPINNEGTATIPIGRR